MKYHFIESTLDIDCSGATVRLWIQIDEVQFDRKNSEALGFEVRDRFLRTPLPKFIEWLIDRIPRLTAIQIIEGEGRTISDGVVVYLVPFEEKA